MSVLTTRKVEASASETTAPPHLVRVNAPFPTGEADERFLDLTAVGAGKDLARYRCAEDPLSDERRVGRLVTCSSSAQEVDALSSGRADDERGVVEDRRGVVGCESGERVGYEGFGGVEDVLWGPGVSFDLGRGEGLSSDVLDIVGRAARGGGWG